MASLNTSADILNWILFQASEPTDGTSDFHAHAIEALNRAYRDIWQGGGALVKDMNEPWLWLKKDPPGVLTLNPVIESGTVSVTNNSASITFSDNITPSIVGRFIEFDGDVGDIFRVSTHTSGTATATLDSPYTGTSGSYTYRAMQLEYTLATDTLRVIAPMRIQRDRHHRIDGMDLTSLDRDYPIAYIESGAPDRFALVTENKIRFNRYGGTASGEYIRVEYDYLQQPAVELTDDSVEPLIPLKDRGVLADLALFYLLQAKGDNRAVEIGAQAKGGLEAMAIDNRARMTQMSGGNVGQIYSRPRNVGGGGFKLFIAR